jgi:DNA polymerase-3 subunit delta'
MLFGQVVGQDELKAKLIATVHEERVSHAQLFEGAAGYGTLPLALAYARYISCLNKGAGDACGVCRSCVKFDKLAHPDLHFVFPVNTNDKVKKDPVSDNFLPDWRKIVLGKRYFAEQDWYDHIGIDNKQGAINVNDTERIIAKLNLKPYEAEVKITVVWLPERMNSGSANRLLKLIEEPPEKTIFLFVTENSAGVLPTIYSRTQRIRLMPIQEADIEKALKHDGHDERTRASAARLSGGNFLRALRIIESDKASKDNFDAFVRLMRFAYSGELLALLEWAEALAMLGREKQKAFIVSAERLVRENFVMNIDRNLSYLGFEEREWSEKFHPFVNEKNVEALFRQLNLCLRHIGQNGNSKIIFTDLAMKVRALLSSR